MRSILFCRQARAAAECQCKFHLVSKHRIGNSPLVLCFIPAFLKHLKSRSHNCSTGGLFAAAHLSRAGLFNFHTEDSYVAETIQIGIHLCCLFSTEKQVYGKLPVVVYVCDSYPVLLQIVLIHQNWTVGDYIWPISNRIQRSKSRYYRHLRHALQQFDKDTVIKTEQRFLDLIPVVGSYKSVRSKQSTRMQHGQTQDHHAQGTCTPGYRANPWCFVEGRIFPVI